MPFSFALILQSYIRTNSFQTVQPNDKKTDIQKKCGKMKRYYMRWWPNYESGDGVLWPENALLQFTLYRNPSVQKKCKLEDVLMPYIEKLCKDVCEQWESASKIALTLSLQLF